MLTIVAGVFMLSVLVVIHELGHFAVAKAFGIGVPVFSVGMGPRVFGLTWRGTEYRLSAVPVGGYVRLAGADPFGESDPDGAAVDPDEDFMRRPVLQRLAVMLAGPGFNLILPVFLFTAVHMLGEPRAQAVVGMVAVGGGAEAAGLVAGDRVVAVEGEHVDLWSEVTEVFRDRIGQDTTLTVTRDGADLDLLLPGTALALDDEGFIDGAVLGLRSQWLSARVGVDGPDTAAALAGLQTGDIIETVDGEPVRTWIDLQAALETGDVHTLTWQRQEGSGTSALVAMDGTIRAPIHWIPRPGEPLATRWGFVPAMVHIGTVSASSAAFDAGLLPGDRVLRIDGAPLAQWEDLVQDEDLVDPPEVELVLVRGGEVFAQRLTPRVQEEVVAGVLRHRPIFGVTFYPDSVVDGSQMRKYFSVTEAVPMAVATTTGVFEQTLQTLGELLTAQRRPQDNLGGPVAIFQLAGQGARAGIFSFTRLVAMISISLGIVNLLPVPVLDGGQILFYLIEAVRGRPLSLAVRERLLMIGVLALVVIMILVTVSDVNRWLTGG